MLATGHSAGQPQSWGGEVRSQFRGSRVPPSSPEAEQSPSAHRRPSVSLSESERNLALARQQRAESERNLALAEAQRAEAARMLDEARTERDIVIVESAKIEEANLLIEQANSELIEAQEAFERRKLGPHHTEMSTQIDEAGLSTGVQTSSELLEPLVAQRALALAAEKAQAVDHAFQTHGAAWLTDVSRAVHEESRSLLALLASRMEVPSPPIPAPRTLTSAAPSAKLQQTWRHALNDEVRRALAPLRERISKLSLPSPALPPPRVPSAPPVTASKRDTALAKATPRAPPAAASDVPAAALDYGTAMWLLDPGSSGLGQMPLPPSSARTHREGPSSASRRVVLASAAGTLSADTTRPKPGVVPDGTGKPGFETLVNIHSQPQSARATARALAFSQLDKAAAKEVAAMRQILRKQQDLLPLMRARAAGPDM